MHTCWLLFGGGVRPLRLVYGAYTHTEMGTDPNVPLQPTGTGIGRRHAQRKAARAFLFSAVVGAGARARAG